MRHYAELKPRVDLRVIPLLLEFDPVKGVKADTPAVGMIDKAFADQLFHQIKGN